MAVKTLVVTALLAALLGVTSCHRSSSPSPALLPAHREAPPAASPEAPPPVPAISDPAPAASSTPPPAGGSLGVDFANAVQPILEARCQPCHFPGGKVYEEMPFDQPETIRILGEALFTRIKAPDEQAMIRAFLAQGP